MSHVTERVWRRSEDNLQGLVLSFHHIDSWDKTRVFRLGCKHLYPLSHLNGHLLVFKMYFDSGGSWANENPWTLNSSMLVSESYEGSLLKILHGHQPEIDKNQSPCIKDKHGKCSLGDSVREEVCGVIRSVGIKVGK